MPYVRSDELEASRSTKAARVRELAAQRRQLEEELHSKLLLQLQSQFVRGYVELGALLRVSPRLAQDIAKRPDSPRARTLGHRTMLWSAREWIDYVLSHELKD